MELDWKDKLGAAFGIDPEEAKARAEAEEAASTNNEVAPGKQHLNVMLDKRNRNGKKVTLITDFTGSDEALKDLAKDLKQQLGVGGSARGGEILIQGDFRQKVLDALLAKGYKARII